MKLSGHGPSRAVSTRRNRALAPAVAFAAALAGCTAASQPPRSVPTAAVTAETAPHRSAAAVPRVTQAASNAPATPHAAAEGVPAAHDAPSAAPSGPAIYSVSATPGIVHGGDKVRWDIRTSPDIVSVSAHVSAVTLPMGRLSAGHFGLTFSVPNGVPFFFHGVYTCDVRAITASGETLHRNIELTFD